MSLQTPKRQTVGGSAVPRSSAAAATPPSKSKTPTSAAVATDSPGNWRHPRLDEITKRRAATDFGESNILTILYNGLALSATYVARTASWSTYQQMCRLLHKLVPVQYIGPFWIIFQLILIINIFRAVVPFFRKPDPMTDIPLTPGQRKLLGLQPIRGSGTVPGAVYTTPPRYARTPSMSSSAAIAAATSAASSTMATAGSRSYAGSPITGSPLFPKTRAAGGNGNGNSVFFNSPSSSPSSPFQRSGSMARRSSFGAFGSPGASLLSESTLSSVPGLSGGTPGSPGSGKRISVGLNNKWLYEKTRRSSTSSGRIY